jgi:tetratricopeptide (TPR) repeat protein
VLPFRNLSRSAELEWLVEGSTTMLGEVLSRWQEIAVVPDDRLYPALRRNGLAAGSVMAQPDVRRVAEETGGWTAVAGEVLATGGRVRVSARAYDVVTGRDLVRAAEEVAAGGDVRPAFERIGATLLRTAGLEAASVDLGAVTTRSLDAYRAYLRGLGHANRAEYLRARDAFTEATRLDSIFAQAYYQLAYALLFSGPMAIFDPESQLLRTVDRAVALADRLPPRMRDVVLGYGAMMQGRFGAAYQLLEPLVRADSEHVDAIAWLSFLHYIDGILVPDGRGGYRRRGSLNTHLQLAARVLALNPARHDAYLPIVFTYALAAGDPPGAVAVYVREGADLRSTLIGVPAQILVPLLLSDSLSLVPVESVDVMPPAVVRDARLRAVEAARAWTTRWLSVGPTEGEAYRAAGKVAELSGDYELALAQVARAEQLGSEFLAGGTGFWRIGLLARLGRYAEATHVADSMWSAGRFARIMAMPNDQFMGVSWAFNLFLLRGSVPRADSLAATVAGRLAAAGLAPGVMADGIAIRLLSGSRLRPFFPTALPLEFRLTVMDSLYARHGTLPRGGRVAAALPSIIQGLAAEAAADSALAARIRAAPWYRP